MGDYTEVVVCGTVFRVTCADAVWRFVLDDWVLIRNGWQQAEAMRLARLARASQAAVVARAAGLVFFSRAGAV